MDYNTISSYINKSYTYNEYRRKTREFLEDNSCSGEDPTDEKVNHTRTNEYRMDRLEKRAILKSELTELLQKQKIPLTWIVLVESWCGDTGQNLPVIAKLAELSLHIDLKIIFRDDHHEIMNEYLTNGGHAILKLICFESSTGKELGTWGPRQGNILKMIDEYRRENPGFDRQDFLENFYLWYGRDRGNAIQQDFIILLQQWAEECESTKRYESIDLM